jgi:hypothetical protein
MKTRPRTEVRSERGIGFLEAIVSLALLLVILSAFGGFMIQSAKINKSRQMAVDAQSTARNCLSLVVQVLRTAGWDPRERGFAHVQTDPDLTDAINFIEVFADLDEDGTMDTSDGEQVLIRHNGNQLEWRVNGDAMTSFDILGVWITNDHDGDGTTDPMFLPDTTPNPTRVTVTITTEAPVLDPQTRRPIRYTVSSDVIFRKEL